jgi:large subunit ribosomal protein L20
MARVKRAPARKKRHKKVFKMAKGYYGGRRKLYRTALETVRRALVYSYRDRKVRKRVFRRLWILRISSACKEIGISYSKFIDGLKKTGIDINRKALADIAINDQDAFRKLADLAKQKIHNGT